MPIHANTTKALPAAFVLALAVPLAMAANTTPAAPASNTLSP